MSFFLNQWCPLSVTVPKFDSRILRPGVVKAFLSPTISLRISGFVVLHASADVISCVEEYSHRPKISHVCGFLSCVYQQKPNI